MASEALNTVRHSQYAGLCSMNDPLDSYFQGSNKSELQMDNQCSCLWCLCSTSMSNFEDKTIQSEPQPLALTASEVLNPSQG